MEKTKRLAWIDFTRGIGMLLVVLGHCKIPNPYWKIIYMFHLPLFFIISGICYSPRNGNLSNFEFIKKITSKYLLPYLIFSLLGISISFIFPKIYGVNFTYEQLGIYAVGVLIGRGQQFWTGQWGAIWYLLATYNLLIVIHIVVKIIKAVMHTVSEHRGGIKIALCTGGGVCFNYFAIRIIKWEFGSGWLPWNFGATFMALPLFYIGNIYISLYPKIKNYFYKKNEKVTRKLLVGIGAAVFAVGLLSGLQNKGIVAFSNNSYGNIFTMYLGAIFCPIGILIINEYLYSSKLVLIQGLDLAFRFIEWIGKNSLFFLGVHGMLIPPISLLINKNLSIDSFKWLIIFFIVILTSSLITLVYKKVKFLFDEKINYFNEVKI